MQTQNQNSILTQASSSQGWQRDATVLQHRETRGNGDESEHQGCSGKSKIPEDSGGSKPKSRIWRHHFHISPDYVPHMERVFSIVRKIWDQKPAED